MSWVGAVQTFLFFLLLESVVLFFMTDFNSSFNLLSNDGRSDDRWEKSESDGRQRQAYEL